MVKSQRTHQLWESLWKEAAYLWSSRQPSFSDRPKSCNLLFSSYFFSKLIHLNSPTFGEEYGYPVYTSKTLCWGDFAGIQTKKNANFFWKFIWFCHCQELVQGIPASSSWLSLRKAVLESQVHARGEGTWENWLSPQRAGGELYKKVVKNDFKEWI